MTAVGWRVRNGGVEDLAAVMVLERDVAEAPHWVEADYAAIFAPREDEIRRCLFVAEVEGRVVGFAVGKVIGAGSESVAELESVVVEVSARRGGVGRGLCLVVVGWCSGEGARVLELEVRVGNAGAIALYEGLGFVAVGQRRAYYHEPVEDAVLMQMELEKRDEAALPVLRGL